MNRLLEIMAHSNGLMAKIIMAGLMLMSVYRSTDSLRTGYVYPGNIELENSILVHDLKCTYLYGGLSHMMIAKHLYGATFLLKTKKAISRINSYSRTSKYQMDSLYRLKVTRLGALWLLHLYLAMVNDFNDGSFNKKEDGQHIWATHGFVIAKLRQELINCRGNNSFDSYQRAIAWNSNPSEQELNDLMDANIAEATELLTTNNICGQPLSENLGNTLQTGCLMLNNLSQKNLYKEDLMEVFNVQVDWADKSIRLTQSWQNARTLYWTTEKFTHLKTYYKLSFDFLKIIIFRLTLKHLAYLESFVKKKLFVRYAKEWYDLFVEFSDMLRLSQDLHIQQLLVYFANLVKENEPIHGVVGYLIPVLETLCLHFGCVATKEFKLNGEEFPKRYKSVLKDEMYGLPITKSPEPIEYYSLENMLTSTWSGYL